MGANILPFEVEGIGRFAARRRTVRVQLEIERKFAAEVGPAPDAAGESLRVLAGVYTDLAVLLAEFPPGWALDEADVQDAYKVYAALRSAEERFRGGLAAGNQGPGQAAQ